MDQERRLGGCEQVTKQMMVENCRAGQSLNKSKVSKKYLTSKDKWYHRQLQTTVVMKLCSTEASGMGHSRIALANALGCGP
jgi:hypothetical protein